MFDGELAHLVEIVGGQVALGPVRDPCDPLNVPTHVALPWFDLIEGGAERVLTLHDHRVTQESASAVLALEEVEQIHVIEIGCRQIEFADTASCLGKASADHGHDETIFNRYGQDAA